MDRLFLILGALSAFIAVAAGAFGAHALKERLTLEMLIVFETAARYQMYHSLALIGVAWAETRTPGLIVHIGGWCFVGGIILFSGSLYALAMTNLRWLGMITPVGGLLFLAGWFCLAWSAFKA